MQLTSGPKATRLALVLTLALAVVIGITTLAPIPSEPRLPSNDKFMHYIAFAVLVLPCAILTPRLLILIAPAALIYGGLIEMIQPYVGRERELLDFVADGIGILCGGAAGLAFGLSLRD